MGDGTGLAGRASLAALLLIAVLGLTACPDPGGEGRATSPEDAVEPSEADLGPAEAAAPPRETERDLAAAAEEPLGRHFDERYPARLESVIERRYLRVLTSRNAFDYFVDDGAPGGYQYEMVRSFTRFLNERHVKAKGELPIQFELVPVDDDRMIPMLLEGAGDLIAARLTITPERARRLRFSRPYRTVDEVLVTHEETAPIETLEALSGRTVAIRATSSYAESLARLDARLAEAGRPRVDIVFVDEALATERILELVAARRFAFTVADSLVAELAGQIHPSLRALDDLPLRRDRKLAWATRPDAMALAKEMDAFLARYREGSLLGNLVAQRYF
jgi:membrane-bound lytic murein transglycosylase MltF